jgi:CheY-like chemotaxis protein
MSLGIVTSSRVARQSSGHVIRISGQTLVPAPHRRGGHALVPVGAGDEGGRVPPDSRTPDMSRPAGEERPVTVLTVDDQDVFRRALHDLIAAMPGFEHVGEAACGAEAIERAGELRPDLVLVDVRMPGMDGIETARRLTQVQEPPVVVLVSLDAISDSPDSCGASAHIRKQQLSTASLRAVWSAHAAP